MGNSVASGVKPMYRMPVSFGPSAGPRNVPADAPFEAGAVHMASVSVSALSDVDALSALLPEECELDGEPLLTARITRLYDIGWLACRSYNIVQVTVPVTFRHEREILHASFMPVRWRKLGGSDPDRPRLTRSTKSSGLRSPTRRFHPRVRRRSASRGPHHGSASSSSTCKARAWRRRRCHRRAVPRAFSQRSMCHAPERGARRMSTT